MATTKPVPTANLGCSLLHFATVDPCPDTAQFGIYEFVRKELMSRKEEEEHTRRSWLPPVVRRTFGMDGELGRQQPEYVKDFLRNVYLLEEELV